MGYVDYIGNLARFAVELANDGDPARLGDDARRMLDEHGVARPGGADLVRLLPPIRTALGEIADGARPDAVRQLLDRYPPQMYLSDHDGAGDAHIHFARDGLGPEQWIGRSVAGALAHLAAGDPGLTLGRCAATGCNRFFVDQSRNRTRRFCGNTCASRTTVAAHRARRRG